MTTHPPASPKDPPPETKAFYLHSMEVLERAGVPFVVAGGYAMAYYTGIIRHTKDLDVFIRQGDLERSLRAFESAGYRTERTWPHFLAKAIHQDAFTDILYASANGLCPVDDAFFHNAVRADILGRQTLLCPPEEMIWSKAFVQDRDRFDGADVAHLLLSRGDEMDWNRLLHRFRGHEPVLLAHLFLFTYIFPAERTRVPHWAMDELLARARAEPVPQGVCQGTFLSKDQYLHDVCNCGLADPRLQPIGPLTPEDVGRLTAA